MKKLILVIAVAGIVGLTSCNKCNTCADSSLTELNHDYCNGIYRTETTMEAAKVACEEKGGSWSEMTE